MHLAFGLSGFVKSYPHTHLVGIQIWLPSFFVMSIIGFDLLAFCRFNAFAVRCSGVHCLACSSHMYNFEIFVGRL